MIHWLLLTFWSNWNEIGRNNFILSSTENCEGSFPCRMALRMPMMRDIESPKFSPIPNLPTCIPITRYSFVDGNWIIIGDPLLPRMVLDSCWNFGPVMWYLSKPLATWNSARGDCMFLIGYCGIVTNGDGFSSLICKKVIPFAFNWLCCWSEKTRNRHRPYNKLEILLVPTRSWTRSCSYCFRLVGRFAMDGEVLGDFVRI